MEPNETTLISGRIIAEFEDDASQFIAGDPEFVRSAEAAPMMPSAAPIPPANDVTQGKPA